MTRSQRVLSLVNLLFVFLCMTHYYIFTPMSGLYLRFGGPSKSMAEIVIGMTPKAALIAPVLYR